MNYQVYYGLPFFLLGIITSLIYVSLITLIDLKRRKKL